MSNVTITCYVLNICYMSRVVRYMFIRYVLYVIRSTWQLI